MKRLRNASESHFFKCHHRTVNHIVSKGSLCACVGVFVSMCIISGFTDYYNLSSFTDYYTFIWIINTDLPFIGFVVNRESSESDGVRKAGTGSMTTHEMEVGSGPMVVPMRTDWYAYCHGISDDGSQIIEDNVCRDGSRLHVHPSLLAKRSQRK